MFLVPTVDIGGTDRAARLDTACREVGFVQITGHGAPDAVADDLRVDPPIVDGRIRRRRSAAFFDGNHDAVIETLPGCSDAGPGYPPITVAENLATKIAGMRTGTFTRTDLRESARVLAAGRTP